MLPYLCQMKITKHTQQKLQEILKAQAYSVRYEKGNFQGGYCVVQDRKMIIINKFHPLEGKINTLMEIIRDLNFDEELLSEEQQKVVAQLKAPTSG
jgi:quinol monooxygenase YgiN